MWFSPVPVAMRCGAFRTWFVLGLLGLAYSWEPAPYDVPDDIIRRNETISQEAWIRIQRFQWVTTIKIFCAACDFLRDVLLGISLNLKFRLTAICGDAPDIG